MKQILVAIRDKKAEAFHPCFCVQNKAVAVRAFGDAILKGGSDLNSHPEDFALYYIATFDFENGTISSADPVEIASGLDFCKKDNL